MYNCQLNVHILSKHSFLETALSKAALPERFSCTIQTVPETELTSCGCCDILIMDPEAGNPGSIWEEIPGNCRLVLCAEGTQLQAIQEQLRERCDDFWVKPFTERFAIKRFEKLLSRLKTEKDLWITQEYLDTAMDSIPDLVWFKDVRGAHLKVNDAFCQAVGKTKEDVQGRGHYYIWDLEPEDYAKGEYVCLETEEEVLRRKETCLFDEKVKSKKGLLQFKTYKSPIFDENGEAIGTVGIAHDVTDLENMITELEIVLGSMPFAILIRNNDGEIINVNERFSEYFGQPLEQVIGIKYDQWEAQNLKEVIKVDEEDYVEATVHADDRKWILEIHEEPIHDIFSNLVGQLCIYRDVTMERTMEEQILHNANTDFMTGLYNRRYFYEYIGKYREEQQVSLIYIDIDCFKQINDTYGHQAGDEALIMTAQLMKECFPEEFITRLGGDEFLITILGSCQLDALERRAKKFQARMGRLFQDSRYLEGLSASIGIAQTNDPAVDIDTVLRQSDMALYQAKQQGRAGCCVFQDED